MPSLLDDPYGNAAPQLPGGAGGLLAIQPPDANAPDQGAALGQTYQMVVDAMHRQQQISSDQGLWANGAPTTKGLLSAAGQYANAVMMGTTGDDTPGYETLYRGGKPTGSFYSTDPEFARQFTQSGQPHEVMTRYMDPSAIYEPPKPVYAGDEDAVDQAIAEAKAKGHSGVRLSEARGRAPGEGEPASVFVFDRSALSRKPPTNQ